MSLPGEPGAPEQPHRRPMRELLLAQAFEACIASERKVRGSAHRIIAHQPAWARADLRRMMGLVASLDTAARDARMSPEFREAARARLMLAIGADTAPEPMPMIGPRLAALPSLTGYHGRSWRRSTWLWRGSAGLLAAVLGVVATLTASASALPGEPLYSLKTAQEALNVRLAADDQSRALALLGQADARLDETTRLLQQGRTDAAVETTQRYGQSVERATSAYVITIDDTPEQAPGTQHLETRLTQQQDQLQTILQTAPEPARADLRQALVTTERGLALVADPRPVEVALGRVANDHSTLVAAVPTTAAEDLAAAVPTRRPAVVVAPPPATSVVAAQATAQPRDVEAVVAQQQQERSGRGDENGTRAQNTGSNGNGQATAPARAVVAQDQQADDGAHAPAAVANNEGESDRSAPVVARGGPPIVRATTQQNNSNATSGESDAARAHDDGGPQPVVAHQPAPPVPAAVEARAGTAGSDNKSDGSGSASGTGVARTATPAALAAKPQVTPTPTPTRHNGGDGGDGGRSSTPVPAHNQPSDPHGGGGDTGHGGDDH